MTDSHPEDEKSYAAAIDVAAMLLYKSGYAPYFPGVLVEFPLSSRAMCVERVRVVRADDKVMGFVLVDADVPDQRYVYDPTTRVFRHENNGCWLWGNGEQLDANSDPQVYTEFFCLRSLLNDYLDATTPSDKRKALLLLHQTAWPPGKRRHGSAEGPPAKRLRSTLSIYS
jgi:hypothetical protein